MLVNECGRKEWINSQLGLMKVIKDKTIIKVFILIFLGILMPHECTIQINLQMKNFVKWWVIRINQLLIHIYILKIKII